MSGSIVIASFGDGLPRGMKSILLQYDTAPGRCRWSIFARIFDATRQWSDPPLMPQGLEGPMTGRSLGPQRIRRSAGPRPYCFLAVHSMGALPPSAIWLVNLISLAAILPL